MSTRNKAVPFRTESVIRRHPSPLRGKHLNLSEVGESDGGAANGQVEERIRVARIENDLANASRGFGYAFVPYAPEGPSVLAYGPVPFRGAMPTAKSAPVLRSSSTVRTRSLPWTSIRSGGACTSPTWSPFG